MTDWDDVFARTLMVLLIDPIRNMYDPLEIIQFKYDH